MSLIRAFLAWLDGFVFGQVVGVQCEFCPYHLDKEEVDLLCSHGDEEDLVVEFLTHKCQVPSHKRLTLVSRRFFFWYEYWTITK